MCREGLVQFFRKLFSHFQMSFEEDSLESATADLLSPESMRRRRQLQGHFSGKPGFTSNLNIKFENAECPNKKVRFRKRAKSLVVGGISSNAEQVGSIS